MDIICKNCTKSFTANPIEIASASVNYSLGRTHTFYCDHCKTGNTLTKAEFEAIKSGKPATPTAKPVAAAPKPVAKPVAAAPKPKPVAKPVAAAPKPVVAALAKADIEAAPQPKDGTVLVRSLRVRKDHSTTSEVVAGLAAGDKVKILSTWADGKNTWAQIGPDQWAAIEHNGEKMIEVS